MAERELSLAEQAALAKKKREEAAKKPAPVLTPTPTPKPVPKLTAEEQQEQLKKGLKEGQSVNLGEPVIGGGTTTVKIPETITDGGKNPLHKTTEVAPEYVAGTFSAKAKTGEAAKAAAMSDQLRRTVQQAGGDRVKLAGMRDRYRNLGMAELANEIDRYLGSTK